MPSFAEKVLDQAEIPPAFSFRAGQDAPLPSEMSLTRDQTSDGSGAYVYDQRKGLYVSRDADVPRYADDPRIGASRGLLVEAAPRTNHVRWSNKINSTKWSPNDVSVGAGTNSIIDGQDAFLLKSQNGSLGRIDQSAGAFSSSVEVIWGILEEGRSSKSGLGVVSSSSNPGSIEYDWGNGSLTSSGDITAHRRILTETGPNGGRVVLLIGRYDPTTAAGTDNSGNSRGFRLFPDRNANDESVYAHHAQIEEAPNASSPIVTGSGAVTRQGDDLTLNVGDRWNPNEGTFLVSLSHRHFSLDGNDEILEGPSNRQYIRQRDKAPPYSFYQMRDGPNSSTANLDTSPNVSPFEPVKIAVSFSDEVGKIAVNGHTGKEPADFSSLTDLVNIQVGTVPAAVQGLSYRPSLLPLTESDRSPGDLPSLETLTSQS